MPVKGIGIDIVENERLKRVFKNPQRIRRMFADVEINYCKKRAGMYQHLGARFCAKEAFLKAVGTGLAKSIRWKDVVVINDKSGRPLMKVYGKARQILKRMRVKRVLLSLSHSKTFSSAVVVLE